MKIAFTHNLKLTQSESEAEFDTPQTVEAITAALTSLGHRVYALEVSGPASYLIARLEALNPDLIFNTAEGTEGRFREAFYPSLFEQLSLPYTGSDPHTCLLTLDKALTKLLLHRKGIRTPRWHFATSLSDLNYFDLPFPAIIKPNFEGSSKGIRQDSVVSNTVELKNRVADALRHFPGGLLIEEYIDGTDITVAFLEQAKHCPSGVLPPCEYSFDAKVTKDRPYNIYDYDLKNECSDAVSVQVSSRFNNKQAKELGALSKQIFQILNVRDFGRIDWRVSKDGMPYFIEINALPSLEPGAGIFLAAESVGLKTYASVLEKIVDSACTRYNIKPKPTKHKSTHSPLVGLTFNLKRIEPELGGHNDNEAEFDSESTVNAIANAIESNGYRVLKLEATNELPRLLTSSGVDVVFNMAEGIRGRTRESQVPALLELMGIEYTGSDATTMSITLDKFMAKKIVRHAGLLTPNSFVMNKGKDKIPDGIRFPVIVKPIAEGSSKGVTQSSVVFDAASLRERATAFLEKYKQPILIEEYIAGREFTVGLLGTSKPKVLPPMEIVFLNSDIRCPVYSFDYKLKFSSEVRYDVPATLTPKERANIERVARQCFAALGCRDVARIDFRMDHQGHIYFLECNPIPGMVPDWSDLCLMANGCGMNYPTLVREIMSPAIKRLRERKMHSVLGAST
jgi:D-alanine-D-alanine ligase